MTQNTIRNRALLLTTAVMLSACSTSNPLVVWKPGPEPDAGIDTLNVARNDAAALKTALLSRQNDFISDKAAVNNTLLGLGVLTLGLATAKVHSDAYTVTAGTAGSTFLFGNLRHRSRESARP